MLVRVEVISIEGGDTLNRLGGPLVTVPHIVGYQNAGVVLSVGPDVTGFAVGDRVVGLAFHGSHAELRVAHPLTTWKIPDGLATELAACVPVAYGTAHDGLFEFGRLVQGETALIHAGAGGVGLAAIQMAKAAGARVIATASSDERLERLREFGLDDGINYREKDFVTEVRALTNNRGADVILDSVGGENLQKSLTALAYRGRCITFGNAGRGEEMKLDTSMLGGSNQSLIGYFLGPELFVGSRAHAMIADLLDDVAAGDLRVEIDRRFALADAEEAHAFIESRQAFGRVILLTE
jgi:NADPH2:quinone reductase